MRALKFQHKEDPAEALRRDIGDVSWVSLFGPTVLVATYQPRSEMKTEGGIILPEQSRDEWLWQGKIGLVLAVGPLAFLDSDDGRYKFCGKKAEVGDWCLYRASDGFQLVLDSHHCRILNDVHILAVIPNPDRVY